MTKKKKIMPYRRKREGKTDYKRRLALLLGNKPRLVIRRSGKNTLLQLVEYSRAGDRVVASAHTSQLKKYGWVTSRSNLPAAYLTGILLGRLALQKKISEAVVDIGLQNSTKGSRLYAALKGALDAGLKIPHSEEVLPKQERIVGAHIASYAKKLKQESPERFQRQNSQYLANKIAPESYQEYFERVKEQIVRKK
jgi:large subunit ribosomal protein L18